MDDILNNPWIQYGGLGLAFFLTTALIRAFFILLAQRDTWQHDLFTHHCERERVVAEQFMACIDRNSAALEKVEQSLQRIQLQLARQEGAASEDTVYVEYP
jgi:uncharacterized membrane protein